MRIILFGAGGRLGTTLQRVLPHHQFFSPSLAEADITRAETIAAYMKAHPADLVVNCAAYNDMDGAETNVELANKLNGTAPGLVAKAAADAGLPIVHFSTDCVFDGTKREGYTEMDVPNPISAYGRSKLMGEETTAANNPKHYIIRTSRLYGLPATDPGAKRSFPEIILSQASKEPTFAVNDGEVSAPTLVDDLAHQLDTQIFSALPSPGIYHMTNEGGATWFEWAKAIIEIAKLPNVITPRVPTERPAKRPAFSVLISTKLPPMRPWKAALEDFLTNIYVR